MTSPTLTAQDASTNSLSISAFSEDTNSFTAGSDHRATITVTGTHSGEITFSGSVTNTSDLTTNITGSTSGGTIGGVERITNYTVALPNAEDPNDGISKQQTKLKDADNCEESGVLDDRIIVTVTMSHDLPSGSTLTVSDTSGSQSYGTNISLVKNGGTPTL